MRAIFSGKGALFSGKSALFSSKRALFSSKRALFSVKGAIYSTALPKSFRIITRKRLSLRAGPARGLLGPRETENFGPLPRISKTVIQSYALYGNQFNNRNRIGSPFCFKTTAAKLRCCTIDVHNLYSNWLGRFMFKWIRFCVATNSRNLNLRDLNSLLNHRVWLNRLNLRLVVYKVKRKYRKGWIKEMLFKCITWCFLYFLIHEIEIKWINHQHLACQQSALKKFIIIF